MSPDSLPICQLGQFCSLRSHLWQWGKSMASNTLWGGNLETATPFYFFTLIELALINPLLKGKTIDTEGGQTDTSFLSSSHGTNAGQNKCWSDEDMGTNQEDVKVGTSKRRKRIWVYCIMRPRLNARQIKWMEDSILGTETAVWGVWIKKFMG